MKRIANWGVFAAVLAATWLIAAPTQLGGPASYVVVDGDSMEPTYADGDLVVARVSASYEVGDVIIYDAPIDARFRVIHRVVEAVDGGYVTQGDNRDEVDGWLAPTDAVHGASWIHVPRGGILVALLRTPSVLLAVVAGWATLALLSRREERDASGDPDGTADAADPAVGQHGAVGARGSGLRSLLVIGAVVGLTAGLGVAHAAGLVLDGGVVQAFSMPTEIEPPQPESVSITVTTRKYDSGQGRLRATSVLGLTVPVGTQYQIILEGGSGSFYVCPPDDGDIGPNPVVDTTAGQVRTATADAVHLVCIQTGGQVAVLTGDDVVAAGAAGASILELSATL